MNEPSVERSEIARQLDWGRVRTAGLMCVSMLILYGGLLIGGALLIDADAVLCFHVMYFRGAVGIPCAIITSLCLVAILAAGTRGEFKIGLWGMSLEGLLVP